MQATAEWLDINFYDVLGVDEDATKKQIKSAYRKLARTAHPDANPDDPSAEARFSDIAKAYEVLADEETRAEYDTLRMQAQRRTPPSGYAQWSPGSHTTASFTDLNDLFGDYFAEQQTRPRKGMDISASLTLDFVDAVQGLTTTLVVDGRSINVRIPAGVQDQRSIRLPGKGSPGINGGRPGDLLIEISITPHPTFGRSGRNLTTDRARAIRRRRARWPDLGPDAERSERYGSATGRQFERSEAASQGQGCPTWGQTRRPGRNRHDRCPTTGHGRRTCPA